LYRRPLYLAKMTLRKILLQAEDGARAEVYTQGAHVASWIPAGGHERLFLSATSEFREGAAIRGGIPVIFPQFATLGLLPKHGFARALEWTLVEPHVFRLTDSARTRAVWKHPFSADLRVHLRGNSLAVSLKVTNTGSNDFYFTAALHTYLRVNDLSAVRLHGLGGVRYVDKTQAGAEAIQPHGDMQIEGETDRVYIDASHPVAVREPGRVTIVTTKGFSDVVIWNPGPGASASMPDLEVGGEQHMLCVEAAVVDSPVELAPGESWAGEQRLEAAE
jgi:glucose-6-phosphate 1-epimerase